MNLRTRWTPIALLETISGEAVWSMRCSCGTEKKVHYKNYKTGKSLSCGCLRLELQVSRRGSHRLPAGESARNQLMLIYRRGASKHGREFSLSRDEFLDLTSSACHYCGHPPHQKLSRPKNSNGSYLYNGIDRKDNSQGYTTENSVPACRMCNYAKSRMTYPDFLDWLDRVSKFRISKENHVS